MQLRRSQPYGTDYSTGSLANILAQPHRCNRVDRTDEVSYMVEWEEAVNF